MVEAAAFAVGECADASDAQHDLLLFLLPLAILGDGSVFAEAKMISPRY